MSGMNELAHVKGADWNLEIGAVADLNVKRRGPALVFEEIKGYPAGHRILTCLTSGPRRLSYILGFEPTDDHHRLVSQIGDNISKWESDSPNFPPRLVSESKLTENVYAENEMDLLKFPAPKWHEYDGGRYLGAGATVITRDPDTGVVNLGTYRMMVQDSRTLGLFILPWHHGNAHIRKYHAKGQPCPIAVSFGHDPLLFVASGFPVRSETSEYNFAGAIRGEPIDVVQGKVTGLPIPASSELALEGFVAPDDMMDEGPFGEFTGYYAEDRKPRPVIRAKALYHRNDPIIIGSPPSVPPSDYSYFLAVMSSAALKNDLVMADVPGVVKVWRHEAGCRYFFMVVSIRQQYAGLAKRVGALVAGQRGFGRYVVVVDEDIDPANLEDVVWAISTRSDPAESIDLLRQMPSSTMDPRVRKGRTPFSSRAVIDACRPFEWASEFPKVVEVSEALRERVSSKWPEVLGERAGPNRRS